MPTNLLDGSELREVLLQILLCLIGYSTKIESFAGDNSISSAALLSRNRSLRINRLVVDDMRPVLHRRIELKTLSTTSCI